MAYQQVVDVHPTRTANIMSQCDTTTQQPSPVPGAAPIISAVVNGDTDTSGSMSINTLPDIKRCGAAEDGDTTLALINPWRQLDRNAFVIAYAMKGTVRCGACLRKVDKGELQLGTFYTHEDRFTLVRWYHQRCVAAPECLTDPMDLCGIEDLKDADLNRVLGWMGFSPNLNLGKSRSRTA